MCREERHVEGELEHVVHFQIRRERLLPNVADQPRFVIPEPIGA